MTSDVLELDVFACALDGVTQIEASAGTGKTWNICALYLRLLLEKDLQADQILVVTFTKAATAELHARIRARLMQLEQALAHGAALDDPFVTGLIGRIIDGDAPETATQRALKRIRRALHGFDQAAIHTIHAFCQRALQEAPFAAAMPFALETEADDAALRFDVAAQFWRERVEPEAARTPGFAHWLVSQGAGPAVLQALLAQRLKKPLAELVWTDPACDATVDTTIDHFDRAGNLWREEREQIAQRLADCALQLDRRTHKPSQVQAALAAWERFFVRGDRYAPISKDALKLTSSSLAAATKAKCQPPAHPFFDCADALVAAFRAEQAMHLRRWFALVREWLHIGPPSVAERKRIARVMSFDDLLANLYRALHTHRWLADALRERYPAALIDEFQDTDPLQFAIFNQIFAPKGPLFLVGDPKQAIYSFRAADLHTYLDARAYASARYTLAVNQRSDPALIAACNRLFGANPRAFVLGGLYYHPVRAGMRTRPTFADRHDPLGATDGSGAALRVWWLPDHAPLSKRDAERAAAEACAAEVARLMRDARAGDATIGTEPLAPANIAVLVQTHRQGMLMKRVLRGWGIGSVELAQASVFASIDAEQFERVLLAIDTPGDLRRLRAALATDWIGLDAAALWAIEQGEPAAAVAGRCEPVPSDLDSASWVERFAGYRLLWHERGFAPMWRIVMRELRIAQRLARADDGERRLTDVNHLAELIQARDSEHPGIAPTLCWLSAQRADPGIGDETQLRLESDRDLVQIVTVHKSKGLEYPVVFCPFLTNGALRVGPSSTALPVAREYHRDDGLAVLHFGCDGDDAQRIDRGVMREQAAERARLIYVALTRAVYRCYLVAGIYASGAHASTKEARQSVLNWLVAGGSSHFDAWLDAPPEAAALAACWRALPGDEDSIVVVPLPIVARRDPLPPPDASHVDVRPRVPARHLFDAWRTASFSSLASARQRPLPGIDDVLHARPDHDDDDDVDQFDAQAIAAEPEPMLDSALTGLHDDDILRFPRGPAAGDCLHRLMELADLRDPSSWPTAIVRALTEQPVHSRELSTERLSAMMMRLLRDLAHTPLEADFMLGELDPSRRLTELEFVFPVASLNMRRLATMLEEHGIAGVALDDGVLHGYLKGFIDAVVEFRGRFWIIDWKSNHLGNSPHAYRAHALSAAMDTHAYRLQALIYTIALHRYLKVRLPDYDYDTHFGASLYLFLRGVRPDWPGAGIERFRPTRAVVEAFDALFSAGGSHA
ncbi:MULTISPECIES: exodeoxyribonuclease V subunit beta [Burkholderiaceae]|uniref:exodeoxyribonuclease V subunit beta n=1 Tax=Burkholderiaceae TaxID=119060 RepID=UPI0009600AA9|nr:MULTISPECIES: exodeoxyribonuclease V subunit beta [Burkholderiaceae]MCG1040761.1 exodeoxyribonuclease V subunit beta [Mycetohabitans sp. B7]SIT65350.1 DNA helicase/exodeoxyribonuclease V, beta subunit [Burkholderia sp. b14]